MPRRTSATTKIGSWKTTPTATSSEQGERVVRACADLDVVVAGVVAGQEVKRGRERDHVTERDARREQHARRSRERGDRPAHPRLERGREEAPRLPEDHRQGERDGRGEAHLQRGGERLRDAEGHRLAVRVRQRFVEPVEQPPVEGVGDGERSGDRADANE